MALWKSLAVLLLLTLAIQSILAEDDDEVLVENDEIEEVESKPEVDTVPYVTPDIDPSAVYFAEHFDSEESFENKWIKSSAKKDGVESAIDR